MVDSAGTIILSARRFDTPPCAGDFFAAPRSSRVLRVRSVVTIRVSGTVGPRRYRLICERVNRAIVPYDAVIRTLVTAVRRRVTPCGVARAPLRADPSLETVARIRSDRLAAYPAQIARAARVGADDGPRTARDTGPAIRSRKIRAKHGEVLREADVEIVDGADPDRPNRTLRRGRRIDPLTALRARGIITAAEQEAVERLREQLEAADPSMPGGAESEIHLPGYQRMGISDRQINARTASREAISAIPFLHRAAVIWLTFGGTVERYAAYAHLRRATAQDHMKTGLARLKDHYDAHTDHRTN